MATVMITGGTGMIGSHIADRLSSNGNDVIILTRDAGKKGKGRISYAAWDTDNQFIDEKAFSRSDHIIHLAGAGVADKRWSDKRKQEIRDSRVNGGNLLVHALRSFPNKVKTLVSASAIGWYGPDPQIPNLNPFTEDDPASPDFLGQTCKDWESSIAPASERTRLVILRTGIVLDKKAGAIKEFKRPLRAGVAAILGNGKQAISWIHVDDLASMYLFAIEQEKLAGIYNAVAPVPVSNKELIICLARASKRFFLPFRVPALLLRVVMGEMSVEVLKSATVSAEKIITTGFQFQFPTIEKAMADMA